LERLIGSKEDVILTFSPEIGSIGAQKSCPKRSILGLLKNQNYFQKPDSKLSI